MKKKLYISEVTYTREDGSGGFYIIGINHTSKKIDTALQNDAKQYADTIAHLFGDTVKSVTLYTAYSDNAMAIVEQWYKVNGLVEVVDII